MTKHELDQSQKLNMAQNLTLYFVGICQEAELLLVHHHILSSLLLCCGYCLCSSFFLRSHEYLSLLSAQKEKVFETYGLY